MNILRVLFVVFVGTRDAFEKIVWIDLSDDGLALEEVAADKATSLTEAAKALVWEAISCATPDIKDAFIEIFIENFRFDGYYKKNILPSDAAFTSWTPELSDRVNAVNAQIKNDLTAMMTDMAVAHLNGDSGRSDPRYEICRRN